MISAVVIIFNWVIETKAETLLSLLAGFVGAAVFTHTAGFFVTFMTGNTGRAVAGPFNGEFLLAAGAAVLIVAFMAGVVVGMRGRRAVWGERASGSVALTAVSLAVATFVDVVVDGVPWAQDPGFGSIAFVAFAMGALNTAFVRNGEVSTPLTYVTGTLVKLSQGIERHLAGGTAKEWSGYARLYGSFLGGGLLGGLTGALATQGAGILLAAAAAAAATTIVVRTMEIRTETTAAVSVVG